MACLTLCIPPTDALLRRHRLHRLVPGAGREHGPRPLLHGELPGLRAQQHHPAVENGEARGPARVLLPGACAVARGTYRGRRGARGTKDLA